MAGHARHEKGINMSKVAVVYYSGTGNTEAIAELVAEGAREAGAEADVFSVDDFDVNDADNYDAFALGCPASGSEELDDSEFVPMLDELEPKISGKNVVLFGSYGHGDGEYQNDWQERSEAAGLKVLGKLAVEQDPSEDEDVTAAKELGAKLA